MNYWDRVVRPRRREVRDLRRAWLYAKAEALAETQRLFEQHQEHEDRRRRRFDEQRYRERQELAQERRLDDTHRRLAWQYGAHHASMILEGYDPTTNADLQAWNDLGEAPPP